MEEEKDVTESEPNNSTMIADENVRADHQSRTQMGQGGNIIDDSNFLGNHLFPSPIRPKSSSDLDNSSVGSTLKANREEQSLTNGQMESFADIIA